MKQEKILLTALFLCSSLNDALDDLTNDVKFVRDLKSNTNKYLKFLSKHVHKEIDNIYKTDAESFEYIERVIESRAKELSQEILTAFNEALN